MKNKMETIPFVDTPEQHAKLDAVIAENREIRGSLIKVLKLAQEIYGYLPLEVQEWIAEGLDIPLEEVYGVVSFYALFSTEPKGKYQIMVCLGTACYVKGSRAIIDKLAELLNIPVGGITPDGKYDVDYDAIDAISTLPADSQAPTQYYTLDGKQLAQPQHGLNLVRRADGTVVKQLR